MGMQAHQGIRTEIASNIMLVAASVGASWETWGDLRLYHDPGGGHGLYRVLLTVVYFTAGWRARSRWRRRSELVGLVASLVVTGTIISDVGSEPFHAVIPGPDLTDVYLLYGVIFAGVWWLRAVTNADYRRMCGWLVVFGAGLMRLLAWPYIMVTALQ